MAKEIIHVVTGVWYTGSVKASKHISHVMIHSCKETNINNIKYTVYKGAKYSLAEAIELIKDLKGTNYGCCTASWNYKTHLWHFNEKAIVEIVGDYIRTEADDTENDNLSHMINLSIFPINS